MKRPTLAVPSGMTNSRPMLGGPPAARRVRTPSPVSGQGFLLRPAAPVRCASLRSIPLPLRASRSAYAGPARPVPSTLAPLEARNSLFSLPPSSTVRVLLRAQGALIHSRLKSTAHLAAPGAEKMRWRPRLMHPQCPISALLLSKIVAANKRGRRAMALSLPEGTCAELALFLYDDPEMHHVAGTSRRCAILLWLFAKVVPKASRS